jgi:hypothetical protein
MERITQGLGLNNTTIKEAREWVFRLLKNKKRKRSKNMTLELSLNEVVGLARKKGKIPDRIKSISPHNGKEMHVIFDTIAGFEGSAYAKVSKFKRGVVYLSVKVDGIIAPLVEFFMGTSIKINVKEILKEYAGKALEKYNLTALTISNVKYSDGYFKIDFEGV